MRLIDLILKSSSVTRYHQHDLLRCQNNAEHQYNVAMLAGLTVLWLQEKKTPTIPTLEEVLLRALIHDVPEVLTGDLSFIVKNHSEAFNENWNRLEAELCNKVLKNMSEEDRKLSALLSNRAIQGDDSSLASLIIKQADIADILWFCTQERLRGNQKVNRILFRSFGLYESLRLDVLNRSPIDRLVADLRQQLKDCGGIHPMEEDLL